MTNLSPAAQHFYDSYWGEGYFEAEELPSRLAAALRAINEYVVLPKYQYAEWGLANAIHQEIEAIANELEAQ
jgi:hypothetical protein